MSATQQPFDQPPDYHSRSPSHSHGGRRAVAIAIRVAIPLLVVGILLIIKPEIITGTLETTGAMLRVGALLLGWLVFSVLVRRFVRPPALRTGLIAAVGLTLLAVTVRPYFIDTRANDALLTGPAAASTQVVTGGPRGETSQSTAVRVSSGQLKGLAGHRGSGSASIVRAPDGSRVVQLEDYDVSSGVTLFLYVVPGVNREQPTANSVNLGKLVENTGNRVVPISEEVDLSGPQTVLIWCEPFTTPIAAATQIPV
ncbi:MAG: DM13 domain-containing protein [Pseudonocardiaceae bacterium]